MSFSQFYNCVQRAKLVLLGFLTVLAIADAARTTQQTTPKHLASTTFAIVMLGIIPGSLHCFQRHLKYENARFQLEQLLEDVLNR